MTDDFDRDRFRAELLLQLPDYGCHNPDGFYVGETPEPDGYDYDRDALAAWILQQVDAAAETPDSELSRVVELAGAGSTVKAFVEFSTYLTALAGVLRRGHTLASQHDLARTISAEAAKLQGIAAELVTAYPSLVQVETPERALVVPGQSG